MLAAQEEKLAVIAENVLLWRNFAQHMRHMAAQWAQGLDEDERSRGITCVRGRLAQIENDTRVEARRKEQQRWHSKWHRVIDIIQNEADMEDVEALSSSQEQDRPAARTHAFHDGGRI